MPPPRSKPRRTCDCQLFVSQREINVKLIVLDRLGELKHDHRYEMQEMVMDIRRALAAPNLDIRRKTLDVVLDLVTTRNIDEVVSALKREITKSQTDATEFSGSTARCSCRRCRPVRHEVPGEPGAPSCTCSWTSSATRTRRRVRRRHVHPRDRADERGSPREHPRPASRLFYAIRSSRVCGTCLWIVGEYDSPPEQVEEAFEP